MKNLKKIKGDASFRKFFRKKNKHQNSIIVFAKKDKFKNLVVYDAINLEKDDIKSNLSLLVYQDPRLPERSVLGHYMGH